ncbi:IPK2a [Symbiodinium microadriaticum]|nr:IPK2a [Symbiodinium microadriaticum]CAE7940788.1 IPK2a [Symbiodinium sp. KB8]
MLGTPREHHAKSEEWQVLGGKAGGAHAEMMINTDGSRILKPLDQGARCSSEIAAYRSLACSPLAPFLCGFHGTRKVEGAEYMELNSAYFGMTGPTATLDIKIGKKTWEDQADPAKIAKESKKFDEIYSASSAMDGFRVAGMKAGDLVLNSTNLKARFSLKTKEFGDWLLPAFLASAPGFGVAMSSPHFERTLQHRPIGPLPEGMAGLCRPDSRGCEVDMRAAAEILGKLKAISTAAEQGFGGTLRAASLLLTREMRHGGRWQVHLIDLAHYTETAEKRDDNFCDGLQNLIRTWEDWCAVDVPQSWYTVCCITRK